MYENDISSNKKFFGNQRISPEEIKLFRTPSHVELGIVPKILRRRPIVFNFIPQYGTIFPPSLIFILKQGRNYFVFEFHPKKCFPVDKINIVNKIILLQTLFSSTKFVDDEKFCLVPGTTPNSSKKSPKKKNHCRFELFIVNL